MSEDLNQICALLDKLTIDSLTLMEQHIQSKINIENVMCNGESDLAKARYIMGQSKVSKLQLPCESSDEFDATAVIHTEKSDLPIQTDAFDLEVMKNAVDPIKWFGVLVPQALHSAQEKFKQAVYYSVKSANLQLRLNNTLDSIGALLVWKEKCKNGDINVNKLQ